MREIAWSMAATNCWSLTARYCVAALNLQSCQRRLSASGLPVSSSSLGFDTNPLALDCLISVKAAVAASAAARSAPCNAAAPFACAMAQALTRQLHYHERFYGVSRSRQQQLYWALLLLAQTSSLRALVVTLVS